MNLKEKYFIKLKKIKMNQLVSFIVTILIYNVLVAIAVLFLGLASINLTGFSIRSLTNLFFNLYFILGLGVSFGARMLFTVAISQASNLNQLQNSATSLTYIVSLSSLIFVVVVNSKILGDTLKTNQIIGSAIIIIGLILLFL